MRTRRLLLILSGLALPAVILLLILPHKSLNPPISIQIVEVATNNTDVRFRVLNPKGLFVVSEEFQLQETNGSIIQVQVTGFGVVSTLKTQFTNTFRFSQPMSVGKTYRVVASYLYRGAFEQKVCWWAERIPVLNLFGPPFRNVVATSEWFVVKSEVSGTNAER